MDTNGTPQVIESASASTAPQTNNSKTPYVIVAVVLGIILVLTFVLSGAIASIALGAITYSESSHEEIIDGFDDEYDHHHHDDTYDEYDFDDEYDYDEGELDFFNDPYMFDFEEDSLIF